jgi:hypothetical protein
VEVDLGEESVSDSETVRLEDLMSDLMSFWEGAIVAC